MKDNNVKLKRLATSLCEEFCRYVVVDNLNNSILINVKQEYHGALVNRLDEVGYVELFRASVTPKNTVTSTFVYAD